MFQIYIYGISSFLGINIVSQLLRRYSKTTIYGSVRPSLNRFKVKNHETLKQLGAILSYDDPEQYIKSLGNTISTVIYCSTDDNTDFLNYVSLKLPTLYISSVAVTDVEDGRLKMTPYVQQKMNMEKIVHANGGSVIRLGFFIGITENMPAIFNGLQLKTWFHMYNNMPLDQKSYAVTNVDHLIKNVIEPYLYCAKKNVTITYCSNKQYSRQLLKQYMNGVYVNNNEPKYYSEYLSANYHQEITDKYVFNIMTNVVRPYMDKHNHKFMEYFAQC